MSDGPERLNPFYHLAIFASALFIVTVLALLAALFGNQNAPAARFLNEFGGILIVAEVAVTLSVGMLALVVDRRATLRRLRERELEQNHAEPTAPSQDLCDESLE